MWGVGFSYGDGFGGMWGVNEVERDSSIIAKEHAVIYVIDDEETLILEEESRSKILDKQSDPISIEKKIKICPIDYSKLNKIKEYFGKRFVTKKELDAEQAFWLKHLNHTSVTHVVSHTPVKVEAPRELPKCLELETELLKKKDFVEKNVFDKLAKSYSTLEKHCISLELATQLNQEIFQRENYGENLNAPTFNQLFEINELKAQSQEKDTVIRKLKEKIKLLSGKAKVDNVKIDIDEIETINIKLEHSVAKLLYENANLRKERDHLKSIFKDQFDSIKKIRVQSKEHSDSLIVQIYAKKLKGKSVVDTAVSKLSTVTIAPGMFKINLEPLAPKVLKNKDAHIGVNSTTSASGSKPSVNTKKNRITRSSSSNEKNKVKEHSRSVKSRKNKMNRVDKTECNAHVMQSVLNVNSI
ncbi:hypothetical protein Tco_0375571 [Tanacetum coccineum]